MQFQSFGSAQQTDQRPFKVIYRWKDRFEHAIYEGPPGPQLMAFGGICYSDLDPAAREILRLVAASKEATDAHQ